jgi:Ankyrin repeats (3 copies)/Ankyrin repeat
MSAIAITITRLSDWKELSVLCVASQRLIDSDDDYTVEKFCHRAADVSAFEDALQQCSTEHFRTEAALSLSPDSEQETVQQTMKNTLWSLLTNALTRNRRSNGLSWSVDGYSMVARIAQSILSSWCIDKTWIDDMDDNGYTVFMQAAEYGHVSVVERLLADPRVDKVSIDHANRHGWTGLMCAASNGHTSVVELLLADPRVDKASIGHVSKVGWTAVVLAAASGHTSIVELLLADPRVDKVSIDRADGIGRTTLMLAARYGHTSIVELLLADPRVDKTSINHTDKLGHPALWVADHYGHFPVAKLLINDSRTSWDSIVQLTHDQSVMQHDDIPPLIIAELTCRQMCVIYPSATRLLWPAPVQSDPQSDDAKSSGTDDDDSGESECALIRSFFKSDMFDVNVLRIIRDYATYTL